MTKHVKNVENSEQILSTTYRRIPSEEADVIHAAWKEGLVAGNGRTGVICSCDPQEETFLFQNIELLMPTEEPRQIPKEVTDQLEEARWAVLRGDDTWNVHGRKRTYLYAYHPGMQLQVSRKPSGVHNYRRWMNPGSGEVCVQFEDEEGVQKRRTFVLRKEDCVVTEISAKETRIHQRFPKKPLSAMTIRVEDLTRLPKFGRKKHGPGPEINLRQERFCRRDGEYLGVVVRYPSFEGSELAGKGYVVVTKILQDQGSRKFRTGEAPQVLIEGAQRVVLLTKVLAQVRLGDEEDFPNERCLQVVAAAEEELEEVAREYAGEKTGAWQYDRALERQLQRQEGMLQGAELILTEDEGKGKSNEELLREQKETDKILKPLAERIYQTGMAVQRACAGYSAPRLCGLWTGEWNPGWSGAYTMDANVNLQVSGMNTGNLPLAGRGYLYFILRQLADWEANAEAVYRMKDALLAPVNTDGNRAVMVEYDISYPFQYWNAGASWLLVPVFEYWQCYGEEQIPLPEDLKRQYGKGSLDLEQEILWPLLQKTMHFWQQLLTPEYYTDEQGTPHYEKGRQRLLPGEHYLIIPSYSPENHPLGYTSAITANAAMDIAAASDTIRMLLEFTERAGVKVSPQEREEWRELRRRLPEYQTDETGGLKEWSLRNMRDNHEHRHISHLYPAWPGVETQNNKSLQEACIQAVQNRNKGNAGKDDTASHGWIHRALVAARLKDGRTVSEILSLLYHSDIFYSSLLTDHNTDRCEGVYCTDTLLGLLGVINEALVYSERGKVELLPALPGEWNRGCIRNLMVRTRACLRSLCWDLEAGTVRVTVESFEDQSMVMSCPALHVRQRLQMRKGEVKEVFMSKIIEQASIPQRILADGTRVPAIGLGTFGSDKYTAEQIAEAVYGGIQVGYRMIDCAAVYQNEDRIGVSIERALQEGIVSRKELFVTSKVWNDMHDRVREACEKSLWDLRLSYLDLYLVHWPFPNYHAPGCSGESRNPNSRPFSADEFMHTWRQCEELADEGKVRYIGMSNMTVAKLKAVLPLCRIKPAFLEMELHPGFQQQELYDYAVSNGIQPIGYCPIGSPSRPERDRTAEDVADTQMPEILEIAKRHGVHPAIICLKWAVQRGQIPIPFSVKEPQYTSNLQCVTEDPLTKEEMEMIRKADKNCRLIKGQVFLWPGAERWQELWEE